MLKAVFIGAENSLNRVIAHYLSQCTDLRGCVWIPEWAEWYKSPNGRRNFIKKRIRLRGLGRALDEAAYRVFYRIAQCRPNSYAIRTSRELIDEYWRTHEFVAWGPYVEAPDVNSEDALRALRAFGPDVIFADCIHQRFGTELRSLAPLGVYIWHIGILPEYRGLYSPFWTLYNGDFNNIGYSLFKMNDELDAGEIFVQGRLTDVDLRRDNHFSIEHKAVFQSFPQVASFIAALEAGEAAPIESRGRSANYYSYPGLSDFIRQRIRLRPAIARQ